MDALPCGSRSMTSTRRPPRARAVARFTAVVVLPTPPFWFAMTKVRRAGGGGAPGSVFHVEQCEVVGRLDLGRQLVLVEARTAWARRAGDHRLGAGVGGAECASTSGLDCWRARARPLPRSGARVAGRRCSRLQRAPDSGARIGSGASSSALGRRCRARHTDHPRVGGQSERFTWNIGPPHAGVHVYATRPPQTWATSTDHAGPVPILMCLLRPPHVMRSTAPARTDAGLGPSGPYGGTAVAQSGCSAHDRSQHSVRAARST